MVKRLSSQVGFTLIELLVVLAVVATLLSLVAPRYVNSLDRSKEAVLRTNLKLTRSAIDQHYSDTGKYPLNLNDLVERRYLRSVPTDPITERADSWLLIGHPSGFPGIYDVRSGATGLASDGSEYRSW